MAFIKKKEPALAKSGIRVIDEKTPIIAIAGPMFIESFLMILLTNVDTMMLSHYDQFAVGAVGNASQVMSLAMIMFNIIASATSVVVAQYLGAKRYGTMNTIYTLALAFNLVVGVVLSGVLVALKHPIMTMLNVSDEMRPAAALYINIVGSFLFIQACYNVMLQILRCNGYTKIGMYLTLTINVLNMVGNYVCLYGPLAYLNLGVAGVAIPTVLSLAVAFTISLIFFYKKKIGRISPKSLIPFPGKMLVQMIKIGLPSAGENLSYTMYQMVLLSLVNSFGNNSVNARVYCNSIISFATIFASSAAGATSVITGHLVGAGKEDAAYKKVFSILKVTMPVTIALSTINAIFCRYTLRIFTTDPEIIAIAQGIMIVDIFVEIGRCLNMTFVNSLKSAGDYLFPLFVGLGTMWLLGVPFGYTFGVLLGLGAAGVFIGTGADEFIRGLIVLHRWYKKKWYGKSVVDRTPTVTIED